ncbi:MAG TPA: nucleoside monophosphate kinase [Candidatus Paceibacterota bacterium]|nr:nucleoside monophosphate kinase [Candidatus Paceibacterota bacterium]
MNERPIVFFIGKPGSGKGTQAQLLSGATGWPVVGTSDGLRDLVTAGGPVGRKLKETMDAGLLTPYWIASYVYLETFFSLPEDGNVIFDGTSRTIPETKVVIESLKWLNRPFRIFYLRVPDDEIHRRINLRKEKEARKDDHVIGKRLEEYYANTGDAIELYRRAGMLTEIDGHRQPEVISAEVKSILKI